MPGARVKMGVTFSSPAVFLVRKSKAADERRRSLARQAREDYQRLHQGVTRTASSSLQEDIVHWFREEQVPLRAGYLGASDSIAPWFHGILTVKRANELLSACVPGSFLVRVSDRTRGYALSYLSDSGCKHFLIDASAGSYSFLGVDQLRHASLADLVEYHKDEPITSLGKELLLHPCGQQEGPPDYLELFE
ncbi:SH2 domain-containing protein 4A [Camelus dromedarius]|uniref:SH2 domain-containing protein 4A n=1 Tax=Camelus dromedarius TaxID=9838 RepID=A0A5N4CF23_CAMDR|nr:SH2 domain-containing protein 4A [Camelus dromedarius]